jgi:aromatic-L-amino-acid decarboxylase
MTPDEFRRHGHGVVDWIADYLSDVGDYPVLSPVVPGQIRAALPVSAPIKGEPFEDILQDFDAKILPGITHWNHPGFFAYFAVTGSAPGILGEMLSAALNVNAMVWKSSPAGTELEELTLDWVRELVGLPPDFRGAINGTASSSSLYALSAAREACFPEAREKGLFGAPVSRIYTSEEAHSSIDKAGMTLGFGLDGRPAHRDRRGLSHGHRSAA